MIKDLNNKEIIFINSLLQNYADQMEGEKREAERKKTFVHALSELSEDPEESKQKFLEATDKLTEISSKLIDLRHNIIYPILEKLSSINEVISEAQPELVQEVHEIITGESVKNEADIILKSINNGNTED